MFRKFNNSLKTRPIENPNLPTEMNAEVIIINLSQPTASYTVPRLFFRISSVANPQIKRRRAILHLFSYNIVKKWRKMWAKTALVSAPSPRTLWVPSPSRAQKMVLLRLCVIRTSQYRPCDIVLTFFCNKVKQVIQTVKWNQEEFEL